MSKGPFTTQFEDTGKFDPEIKTTDQRISMLKERIDELEMVLSEYYLDGAVFREYASERNKLKVARTASIASRATGKTGSESYTGQQNEQSAFQRRWGNTREPLVLPSQTLMESQHQHRGQLPSPQFPPVYARQSQEHTRRQSPEPSALVYYQQQLQKNRQHGKYRSESEQSLLAQLVEDDEEFISPRDAKRYPDQDQQTQGLLQQDHHGMHQTFLEQQERRIQQQQEQPPAFPPRPPKGNIKPIIVNAPLQAPSLLSPSPPLAHASPIDPSDSRSASWRSDGTDRGLKPNTMNSRSIFGSSTYSGHTSTTGTMQYEHVDMSDMSRMVREREL
ncbi:hypothetical protein BGZ80_011698 [Entomortierella chlamydospora]|uniref:Uncharacterized protein n=1 Tax=Entomortierella chlamydospora TaxID=101097 RepID=A0A9P6MT55_9FUNG|nr:hypothetical protein BGZ80_011698 [Entomortierella chlamydospora]